MRGALSSCTGGGAGGVEGSGATLKDAARGVFEVVGVAVWAELKAVLEVAG